MSYSYPPHIYSVLATVHIKPSVTGQLVLVKHGAIRTEERELLKTAPGTGHTHVVHLTEGLGVSVHPANTVGMTW